MHTEKVEYIQLIVIDFRRAISHILFQLKRILVMFHSSCKLLCVNILIFRCLQLVRLISCDVLLLRGLNVFVVVVSTQKSNDEEYDGNHNRYDHRR